MPELLEAEIEELDGDTEMEDVTDFIASEELQLHALVTHENPYRPKQAQANLVHWSCKISNPKNKFVIVYFSKGTGLRTWCHPPQTGLDVTIPLHVPHGKLYQPYDGPTPPFDNERDELTYRHCSTFEPPYLAEILDVLAKDIWLVEQAGPFEIWANVLQLNHDSIAARKAYDVIYQQRHELMALLGEEPYHRLIYEIERLDPWKFAEIEEPESEQESDETT